MCAHFSSTSRSVRLSLELSQSSYKEIALLSTWRRWICQNGILSSSSSFLLGIKDYLFLGCVNNLSCSAVDRRPGQQRCQLSALSCYLPTVSIAVSTVAVLQLKCWFFFFIFMHSAVSVHQSIKAMCIKESVDLFNGIFESCLGDGRKRWSKWDWGRRVKEEVEILSSPLLFKSILWREFWAKTLQQLSIDRLPFSTWHSHVVSRSLLSSSVLLFNSNRSGLFISFHDGSSNSSISSSQ